MVDGASPPTVLGEGFFFDADPPVVIPNFLSPPAQLQRWADETGSDALRRCNDGSMNASSLNTPTTYHGMTLA
ncbi:hypothetical protein E4U21_006458 [Claviceps maximensis]|nr:hypothetical protein E4U21_006458 [Claviceps maximensis]